MFTLHVYGLTVRSWRRSCNSARRLTSQWGRRLGRSSNICKCWNLIKWPRDNFQTCSWLHKQVIIREMGHLRSCSVQLEDCSVLAPTISTDSPYLEGYPKYGNQWSGFIGTIHKYCQRKLDNNCSYVWRIRLGCLVEAQLKLMSWDSQLFWYKWKKVGQTF